MVGNSTSRGYDAAIGIMRSDFFIKAGYLSFSEIQKFVGFTELNLFFRESSQEISILFPFFVRIKDDGVGWTKGSQIHS